MNQQNHGQPVQAELNFDKAEPGKTYFAKHADKNFVHYLKLAMNSVGYTDVDDIAESSLVMLIAYEVTSEDKKIYNWQLSLSAVDAAEYQAGISIEYWKTTVTGKGKTSKLKTIFPVLMAAAIEYLGKGTQEPVQVELGDKSRLVEWIKGP